jgi:hypothetical protein
MFKPKAAREKIRKGMRMAENQYSLATPGMTRGSYWVLRT